MLKVEWIRKKQGETWFKLVDTNRPISPLFYKVIGKSRLEEYYIAKNNGLVLSGPAWIKVKHKGLTYNINDIYRAYRTKLNKDLMCKEQSQLEFFDMRLIDLVGTL